eukprot:g737.t1
MDHSMSVQAEATAAHVRLVAVRTAVKEYEKTDSEFRPTWATASSPEAAWRSKNQREKFRTAPGAPRPNRSNLRKNVQRVVDAFFVFGLQRDEHGRIVTHYAEAPEYYHKRGQTPPPQGVPLYTGELQARVPARDHADFTMLTSIMHSLPPIVFPQERTRLYTAEEARPYTFSQPVARELGTGGCLTVLICFEPAVLKKRSIERGKRRLAQRAAAAAANTEGGGFSSSRGGTKGQAQIPSLPGGGKGSAAAAAKRRSSSGRLTSSVKEAEAIDVYPPPSPPVPENSANVNERYSYFQDPFQGSYSSDEDESSDDDADDDGQELGGLLGSAGQQMYAPKALCLFSRWPYYHGCRCWLAEILRAATMLGCLKTEPDEEQEAGAGHDHLLPGPPGTENEEALAPGSNLSQRLRRFRFFLKNDEKWNGELMQLPTHKRRDLILSYLVSYLLYEVPLPAVHEFLVQFTQPTQCVFTFGANNYSILDPESLARDLAFEPLFKLLSLKTIAYLWFLGVCERRLVLVCQPRSRHLLNFVFEALITLLWPFGWPHSLVIANTKQQRSFIGMPSCIWVGTAYDNLADLRNVMRNDNDGLIPFVDIDRDEIFFNDKAGTHFERGVTKLPAWAQEQQRMPSDLPYPSSKNLDERFYEYFMPFVVPDCIFKYLHKHLHAISIAQQADAAADPDWRDTYLYVYPDAAADLSGTRRPGSKNTARTVGGVRSPLAEAASAGGATASTGSTASSMPWSATQGSVALRKRVQATFLELMLHLFGAIPEVCRSDYNRYAVRESKRQKLEQQGMHPKEIERRVGSRQDDLQFEFDDNELRDKGTVSFLDITAPLLANYMQSGAGEIPNPGEGEEDAAGTPRAVIEFRRANQNPLRKLMQATCGEAVGFMQWLVDYVQGSQVRFSLLKDMRAQWNAVVGEIREMERDQPPAVLAAITPRSRRKVGIGRAATTLLVSQRLTELVRGWIDAMYTPAHTLIAPKPALVSFTSVGGPLAGLDAGNLKKSRSTPPQLQNYAAEPSSSNLGSSYAAFFKRGKVLRGDAMLRREAVVPHDLFQWTQERQVSNPCLHLNQTGVRVGGANPGANKTNCVLTSEEIVAAVQEGVPDPEIAFSLVRSAVVALQARPLVQWTKTKHERDFFDISAGMKMPVDAAELFCETMKFFLAGRPLYGGRITLFERVMRWLSEDERPVVATKDPGFYGPTASVTSPRRMSGSVTGGVSRAASQQTPRGSELRRTRSSLTRSTLVDGDGRQSSLPGSSRGNTLVDHSYPPPIDPKMDDDSRFRVFLMLQNVSELGELPFWQILKSAVSESATYLPQVGDGAAGDAGNAAREMQLELERLEKESAVSAATTTGPSGGPASEVTTKVSAAETGRTTAISSFNARAHQEQLLEAVTMASGETRITTESAATRTTTGSDPTQMYAVSNELSVFCGPRGNKLLKPKITLSSAEAATSHMEGWRTTFPYRSLRMVAEGLEEDGVVQLRSETLKFTAPALYWMLHLFFSVKVEAIPPDLPRPERVSGASPSLADDSARRAQVFSMADLCRHYVVHAKQSDEKERQNLSNAAALAQAVEASKVFRVADYQPELQLAGASAAAAVPRDQKEQPGRTSVAGAGLPLRSPSEWEAMARADGQPMLGSAGAMARAMRQTKERMKQRRKRAHEREKQNAKHKVVACRLDNVIDDNVLGGGSAGSKNSLLGTTKNLGGGSSSQGGATGSSGPSGANTRNASPLLEQNDGVTTDEVEQRAHAAQTPDLSFHDAASSPMMLMNMNLSSPETAREKAGKIMHEPSSTTCRRRDKNKENEYRFGLDPTFAAALNEAQSGNDWDVLSVYAQQVDREAYEVRALYGDVPNETQRSRAAPLTTRQQRAAILSGAKTAANVVSRKKKAGAGGGGVQSLDLDSALTEVEQQLLLQAYDYKPPGRRKKAARNFAHDGCAYLKMNQETKQLPRYGRCSYIDQDRTNTRAGAGVRGSNYFAPPLGNLNINPDADVPAISVDIDERQYQLKQTYGYQNKQRMREEVLRDPQWLAQEVEANLNEDLEKLNEELARRMAQLDIR